jgi:hypothetical protein
MDHSEWSDGRIPKIFFRTPVPPTSFETEAFTRRVMARIEESRSPAFGWVLEWFSGRWTVPALGLGIATLFLSILYSGPISPLTLEASLSPDSAPSSWVLPIVDEP